MNRLKFETSPYLLQHQENPVHWYAWGDAAFAKAEAENKPILLSIGYAACHWCHVMAHESFEEQKTADLMNDLYINVKVDREERPDVDKIYMEAIQSLGEQGGWPLTMFLTPKGQPFWGGTYFPPEPKFGRPSFTQVLTQIHNIWTLERHKVNANVEALTQALLARSKPAKGQEALGEHLIERAIEVVLRVTDFNRGGLNGAPKFPQTFMYALLWQHFLKSRQVKTKDAVFVTMTNICQGGIYDHLAGGFSRYSVDERWLVPHFEKMLYDNASLIELLSQLVSHDSRDLFRNRIEETVSWLTNEMLSPDGSFYASLDADSEGEEGKFYVWDEIEVHSLLDEQAAQLFCKIYDVTPEGNWEGKNILNRLGTIDPSTAPEENQLRDARSKLLAYRNLRPRPGTDTKILSDWNGLIIDALARASIRLNQPDWLAIAEKAFLSVLNSNFADGCLWHSWCSQEHRGPATIDDFANLVSAALTLFQITGQTNYLDKAKELQQLAQSTHWNDDVGGFYFSSKEDSHLIVRSCFAHDDATPNGNATSLRNYATLFHITGDGEYDALCQKIISAFSGDITRNPVGYASFLSAYDFYINATQAVIINANQGPSAHEYLQVLFSSDRPHLVCQIMNTTEHLAQGHPAKGKTSINDQTTLYLCQNQACGLPITELNAVNQ